MAVWGKLVGEPNLSFNHAIYESERDCADRNRCLGYMMQEKKAFQQGKNKGIAQSVQSSINWNSNSLEDCLDI